MRYSVATSVETAALLSKKALMRPIGSHNENERAAKMEKLLEDGINAIGLGPQGMGGKYSVMGVNIENTACHPSAIGVVVNVGCWSHRRGHIIFDRDLNYEITTHTGGRIIEMARKTPADLGHPRDISACLIYWFLFLFLYFPVFSYLRMCSSVFCESIYSLTFSMTVVPVVAMK